MKINKIIATMAIAGLAAYCGLADAQPAEKLNILAFAAHPDDVELNVGGTLLKYKKAGHNIFIAFATSGNTGSNEMTDTKLIGETREKEAREAGVNGFLSKPLFPSDLQKMLRQFCGKADPGRRNTPSRFRTRRTRRPPGASRRRTGSISAPGTGSASPRAEAARTRGSPTRRGISCIRFSVSRNAARKPRP